MHRHMVPYAFAALCVGAALVQAEETCTTGVQDADPATGGALLQRGSLSRPSDKLTLLSKDGYSAEGYLGTPSCLPAEKEIANRNRRVTLLFKEEHRRASLLATESDRESVGATAPLDAVGFKQTTALCCPMDMEVFFTRLLDSKGLDVCSKPHVQGLMHWFSCVPDMDFNYVLQVIDNGNPCKYWAPKGEACPALSPQCEGHHCGAPITDDNTPVAPTDAPVAPTEAPVPTAAPTNAPVAPTEAPTTTKAPTQAPTTTKAPAATTAVPATTTLTENCYNDVALNFKKDDTDPAAPKVTHSNLGGLGPDSGVEEFRVGNVGTHEGQPFDLVMTATGTYQSVDGYPEYNGLYNDFGVVYVLKETSLPATYTIVKSGTNEPFVLPKFYFSFFDLDAGMETEPIGAEKIATSGFAKYYVHDETELKITEEADGTTSFEATVKGGPSDNPTDALALTELQQKRTVTFLFLNTASFSATYTSLPVTPSRGRDLFFSGKSTLVMNECEEPAR